MNATASPNPFSARFFDALLRWPRLVLALSLVAMIGTAAGLAQLVKDTSVDAFIPPSHPSILANELAEARFGLADPIVIALVAPDTIFKPRHLAVIESLHNRIEALPNVRADRVMSLASESAIEGFSDRIEVNRYLEAADAAETRRQWTLMPPHQGTLVSKDGRGAVIVAELIDQSRAGESYRAIDQLLAESLPTELTAQVAGQGAVGGHLSDSIDQDSRVLQPMIFLVVLAVLYLAFRRLAAVGLPLLIIVGATGGAIGIMAYAGVSYFAITSALPVILVAIAVADTIHILSSYYPRRAQAPTGPVAPLVAAAMGEQAGPITITTVTTMAGFLGIAIAEVMPPIVYFAQFAALGVGLAWLYAMLTLPCALVLLAPRPSPRFPAPAAADGAPQAPTGRLARSLSAIATASARHPYRTLAMAGAVVALAIAGASQLRVDRALVEGFKASAPIRQADEAINARFAGTSFLDIMIEAPAPEGLLTASAMRQITDLQAFLESLPRVQHTMAITDYLTLLHQAIEAPGAAPAGRALPAQDDAIAQYLLVYEASGDPTDFEEEIDGEYRTALLRAVLNTRYFSEERAAVEALEQYLATRWDQEALKATISGRVNVRYHWMARLAEHHFAGVALSLLLVFGIAAALFRSLGAGFLAVVPVSLTVLLLYGLMGATGIYLEPATTMFAAISLGLGVDFAIHLIARLQLAVRALGNFDQALAQVIPGTARACFFNAFALGAGFAVLLASELLTLKRFGGMVAAAALLSFLAALVLVPAGYRLLLGTRVSATAQDRKDAAPTSATLTAPVKAALSALLCVASAALVMVPAAPAQADEAPEATLDGNALAAQIAARVDGDFALREVEMTMTNRRGKSRSRQAMILRASSADARRTLIMYRGPKAVRETAFLGYDYHAEGQASDQWLYLPAMRKTRRIPASDRGDYFLGTDFTYEDMQAELKFNASDYRFEEIAAPDRDIRLLRGTPHTPGIARELGYGGFTAEIDMKSLLPRRIAFSDPKGEPLKVIEVTRIDQIDDIWTATEIVASNSQTGHVTHFSYREVRFPKQLPEQLFTAANLRRGIPRL
jgi:predicted RND superfamily exporter protein